MHYSDGVLERLKEMLSAEDYERMERARPLSLEAAARAGIKHAALVRVHHFFKRR